MIRDIEQLVDTSVAEVFGTMLAYRVQREPLGSAVGNSEPLIASSVGFIGRLSGVVFLYSTHSFALNMTSRLLGISQSEIETDEMVNDAMGELANMVVGIIKSRLSDRGMPCVLTIPSIVRGIHLKIQPVSSAERKFLTFRCNDGQLVVELMIKATEPALAN
jgi:chemotaxis protein CheX